MGAQAKKLPWYQFFLLSLRFKIAFFFVFFACLVSFFTYISIQEINNDNTPEVNLIDMEMRKKIRDFSSVVKTGLYIKNFELFDVNIDKFIIDLVVWFEFNSDEIMPDIVEKFSFLNGKILEKTPGDVRIDENHKMFVKYNVRVQVKGQFNYHKFPFEDHTLPLQLLNDYVTPNEMYFLVDNSSFLISDQAFASDTGWYVKGTGTSWGYRSVALDENDQEKQIEKPVVVYSIYLAQTGQRGLFTIFIPILVALFFGMLTFLMSVSNVSTRFRLSLGSMTALLSYRFVIERMTPTVGYFTLIDAIFTLFLVVAFLVFLYQIGLSRYISDTNHTDGKVDMNRVEIVHGIIYYLIGIVLVIGVGIILL